MRKRWTLALVAAVCGFVALGCAGDIGQQVMSDTELQAKVMDMITADSETAGGMVDRLLSNDSTRTMMIEKLLASAGGAQAVMQAVAEDQTMLDGALNLAVQDDAMKEHVMALFQGMKMAGVK